MLYVIGFLVTVIAFMYHKLIILMGLNANQKTKELLLDKDKQKDINSANEAVLQQTIKQEQDKLKNSKVDSNEDIANYFNSTDNK